MTACWTCSSAPTTTPTWAPSGAAWRSTTGRTASSGRSTTSKTPPSAPSSTRISPSSTAAAGIGCISDTDPQPLLVRSHLGLYAITTVGIINNADALVERYFSDHGHQFMAMSSGKVNSTELAAALINQEDDLVSGIRQAQAEIDGSCTMLILTPDAIIAARDGWAACPCWWARPRTAAACPLSPLPTTSWATTTPMSWAPARSSRSPPEGGRPSPPPGTRCASAPSCGPTTATPTPTTRGSTWRSCATATARSWPGTR